MSDEYVIFAKNWYKMLVMAALIVLIGVMAYKLTAGKKQEVPYMKKAADFQMQNVDGTAVSLADLKGKTSLLYFFSGRIVPTSVLLQPIESPKSRRS